MIYSVASESSRGPLLQCHKNGCFILLLTMRFSVQTALWGHFTPSPIVGIRVKYVGQFYSCQLNKMTSTSANIKDDPNNFCVKLARFVLQSILYVHLNGVHLYYSCIYDVKSALFRTQLCAYDQIPLLRPGLRPV